jgi:hypothetical protein
MKTRPLKPTEKNKAALCVAVVPNLEIGNYCLIA